MFKILFVRMAAKSIVCLKKNPSLEISWQTLLKKHQKLGNYTEK